MKSRPVCRDPVWTSIEVYEHRRIAARGDNPICDRSFLKLIAPQQFGSFGALDAVLSIEDVCGAAIGIAYGAGIWQSLDLTGPLLAVVAVADTWSFRCSTRNGTLQRLKSRGVEITTEPRPTPWQPGRTIAKFRDSEGNHMVIISR